MAQPQATGKTKGKWRVLSLLGMAAMVVILNGLSVNISISVLVKDLNTTVSAIQAVLSLYALVTAVCMLPGTKLADRFGAVRIFPFSVLLYGCGALVVALAQNSAMLLVGMSVVQGLAASLMMPTALALLSAAYPGPQRAGALAAYSAITSVTMALAPLVAGAISTYLNWRLVYAIEVVLIAIILLRLRLLKTIKAPKPDPAARFDVPGSLLSALALFCIIASALLAKTYGWFWALRPFTLGTFSMNTLSPVAVLLGAGLLSAAALVLWLRHAKRKGRPVLIDISLFKNRSYDGVLLTKILTQLAMMGIMFVIPVYLQNVTGYTAFGTGVSLLPLPLMLFLTSLVVVRLTRHLGRKWVIFIGTLLVSVGAVVMWLTFSGSGAAGGITGLQLLPSVVLLGAGMGCVMSPANTMALSSVPPALANQGSGTLTTVNNLASSLGTAITGTLLLGGIRSVLSTQLVANYPAQVGGYSHQQLAQLLAQAADEVRAGTLSVSNLSSQQAASLKSTLFGALDTSMAHLMFVMACVAAAAALIVLLLLPARPKHPAQKPK